MAERARSASPPRRLRSVWLLPALLGTACSFFGPSYDEYAKPKPPADGGSSGTANQGGTPMMNAGGAGSPGAPGGAPNAGEDTGPGGSSGSGGDAGAGGVPEEPDPPPIQAQPVASDEYRLEPTIQRGVPLMALIVSYSSDEATVTAQNRDLPRYQPYDQGDPAYWDYVESEIVQTRAHVVVLPSRGASNLTNGDFTGPGNMNPRRVARWWAAAGRASAQFDSSAIFLLESAYMRDVSNQLHGYASGTVMDLSVQSDWDDVFWQRGIKPWFDALPQNAWYTMYDHPVIQLGPLDKGYFANANGNLTGLLTKIHDSFSAAYGKTPWFIVDETWIELHPAVANYSEVLGTSPWLWPTTSAIDSSTFQNFTTSMVVPGAVDPYYYGPPGNYRYQDPAYVLPRITKDAYGHDVVTLASGLANALPTSDIIEVQGLNAATNRASLYASDAPDWPTPHRYLNELRHFADPKTDGLRLEAENCDRYSDSTPGNSGNVFLRSGDLDIRKLASSGWAVTGSAADEWIEFDHVDFSAGLYRFIAKYSTSSGGAQDPDKKLELIIDGHKQTQVILPDTATTDTFDIASLGTVDIKHGTHDLRLRNMSGFVDLDWLFIRKLSPRLSLLATNAKYVSAQEAGGGDVKAGAPAASIFEEFTFDDLNGGELEDGDDVFIQAYDGLYLTLTAGPGVQATARTPATPETFKIKLISGAKVAADKSTIAILASDGTHYLTVGPNDLMDFSGTGVFAAQTFVVGVY